MSTAYINFMQYSDSNESMGWNRVIASILFVGLGRLQFERSNQSGVGFTALFTALHLAQAAYQQGASITHNLIALAKEASPRPVPVNLRGTLMKLGLGNGVANLFDKVQVTDKLTDLTPVPRI